MHAECRSKLSLELKDCNYSAIIEAILTGLAFFIILVALLPLAAALS